MPISISCTQCKAQLKIKDSLAGKRIACPKCQGVIAVPQAEVLVEPVVESASPLDGDLSSWDLSKLNFSNSDDANGNSDPFGGPGMELPSAAPFPAAASVSAQPKSQQKNGPKSQQKIQQKATKTTTASPTTGVRKSSIFMAIGAGLFAMFFVLGTGGFLIWWIARDSQPLVAPNMEPAAEQLVTNTPPAAPEKPTAPESTGKVTGAAQAPITYRPITKPDGSFDFEALKAATVLVKMTATTENKSGTGFLIDSSPAEGLVIASATIIESTNGSVNEISCVFNSGTSQEFVVAASVVGKDESLDLAILKVQHNNLPPKIPFDQHVEPMEKMNVISFGFPNKSNQKASGRNQTITTTNGSITSVKKDEYGLPRLVQFNRQFDIGNAGGPVFNENGFLLGIAVSKKPIEDQQEYAIPRAVLTDSIEGRVVRVNKQRTTAPGDSKPAYAISMQLLDPRNEIEAVDIYSFAYADQTIRNPHFTGKWEIASQKVLRTTNCQLQTGTASAVFQAPPGVTEVMLQYRVKRKSGREWLSEPIPLTRDEGGDAYIAKAITPQSSGSKQSEPDSDPKNATLSMKLPSSMASFAINPTNGDLAGVDPLGNEAVLFRGPNYESKDPAPKVSVGITPIAIQYKKFGDAEYYVVVCTQDSNMYVIDAKEFTLVKKIPLTGQGISEVSVSKNTKDPFVYYCYGGGHDSLTGAVDLRKMTSIPEVMKETMDCDISADGRIAYRRGAFSPSGFVSLSLTNSFDDEKPVFAKLVSEHNSAARYFADPNGEYTASGDTIYSKDLRANLAKLDFTPMCFLQSKPIIFGLDKQTLRAASYNTLSPYERGFQIPFNEETLKETPLARGAGSFSDFKTTGYQTKLLADEANGRIVVARRDSVFIVPFSAFGIPDEPLLAIDVSPTDFQVGSPQKISITPRTKGIEFSISNLPKGAVANEQGFEWTPKDENVGKSPLTTVLTYGSTKRTVNHYLNVSQPHVSAPIEISKFEYDEAEDAVVCWSRDGLDDNGNIDRNTKTVASPRIAVIPFKPGETVGTIEHTEPIKAVYPIGSRLAVLFANEQNKVDIYERPEMKRIKTLVAESPITEVKVDKDSLLIMTGAKAEVYQLSSLKRLRTSEVENANIPRNAQRMLKDGILIDGMLMDPAKNTPRLLMFPQNLPAIEGAEPRLYSGDFLRRASSPEINNNQDRFERLDNNTTRIQGPLAVPKKPWTIELTTSIYSSPKQSKDIAAENRYIVAINLISSKTKSKERIVIVEESFEQLNRIVKPYMQILDDSVLVAYRNKLYRWKLREEEAAKEGEEEEANEELYVEPQQSAFVVKGTKASLKHTIHGGKAPFEFVTVRPVAGVSIDESTGNVTLDSDAIAEAAKRIMVGRTKVAPQEINDEFAKIQNSAAIHAETIAKKLKIKVQGYPVAVPIHFKVVDSDGHVAEMQYFVIVEISVKQIRKLLQQK